MAVYDLVREASRLVTQPTRSLYQHVRHPWVEQRRLQGPIKVSDQLPRNNAVQRFNARAATLITRGVGTMWCAYIFAAFDLLSLPAAIKGGTPTLVSWVAQTFLQLVLLSIIMVGQTVQAKAADTRNDQSFCDVEAILHEQAEQGKHLAAQDDKILEILTEVRRLARDEPVAKSEVPWRLTVRVR